MSVYEKLYPPKDIVVHNDNTTETEYMLDSGDLMHSGWIASRAMDAIENYMKLSDAEKAALNENVIIPDIRKALQKAKGRKVYFCNAMTQPGETDGYAVEDHVQALKDHGAPVDAVIVACDSLPEKVLQKYAKEGSTPVLLRQQEHDYQIIPEQLLAFDRELIRHDSLCIEKAIRRLLEEL